MERCDRRRALSAGDCVPNFFYHFLRMIILCSMSQVPLSAPGLHGRTPLRVLDLILIFFTESGGTGSRSDCGHRRLELSARRTCHSSCCCFSWSLIITTFEV
ncbi:unnamed protein product [Sphacelaria rigidula]